MIYLNLNGTKNRGAYRSRYNKRDRYALRRTALQNEASF